MSEDFFLEIHARISDTDGYMWCTGSLGTQYNVPKHHWVWKYFKDPKTKMGGSNVYEWDTASNPHFSQARLKWLQENLDIRTYEQMYKICWDAPSRYAVYEDLDDANFKAHEYNPRLETTISIDWGWTNDMAVGFFQYDPHRKEVYLFDEIVVNKTTLDDLWKKIQLRQYKIKRWYCDAAGKQTREQSGISNVGYFRDKFGINFEYRQTAISYGIPIVRSFIRNGMGQCKFFISPNCTKSIDQMRNYRYAERNGIMTEEPVKEHDHCPDMIRYYFVNRHDLAQQGEPIVELERWGKQWLT